MKNFKSLMESWRGYTNKILVERTLPASEYPATYEELRNAIGRLAEKTWIFFDTETTGLDMEQTFHQITQLAAIKVDTFNFQEGTEPKIVDKFDKRIILSPRSAKAAANEEAKVARHNQMEQEKAAQDPSYSPKPYPYYTITKALNMTGYKTADELEEEYNRGLPEDKKITIVSISDEERSQNPALHEEGRMYFIPTLVLKEFASFVAPVGEHVLVAQNAPFDVQYINVAFRRAGLEVPDDVVMDSVVIFKKFLTPVVKDLETKIANNEIPEEQKQQVENIIKNLVRVSDKTNRKSYTVSLGPMRQAFGVKDEGWHNALADVVMLAKVMKEVFVFLDKNEFVKGIKDMPMVQQPETELQARIRELEKYFSPTPDTPRDAPEPWERGKTDPTTGEVIQPPSDYYIEYTNKKKELKALKDKLKMKPSSDGKASTIDERKKQIRRSIK
jgi:DNA polymerase III epsilon subunit-like protein